MKILFCGDVVGRSGREAIKKYVPLLRQRFALDFVIANGENAAAGFGITQAICREFYQNGVDVVTTGNHIWDQREILATIHQDKHLLRPINGPETWPGNGYGVYKTLKNQSILVVNVMARLFMDSLDDPFKAVSELLKKYSLPNHVQAIVLDFHGEATSEKMAMGHFCDGKVSLVVGSHTHVPTADEQILPQKTAYQSDAGMCGDYDSIIGMRKEDILPRFIRRLPSGRASPAEGEGTLCATLVLTDDNTGLAVKIYAIRLGGKLSQTNLDNIFLNA